MLIRRDMRTYLILAAGLLSCFSFNIAQAAIRPGWTTSKIHGSPEPPEPYKIVSSFPQLRFTKPTSIEEIPGSGRLLITEMAGKVFSFPKSADVGQADLVLDLIELLPKDLAKRGVSLFDAEFHPRFADNRYLFVSYV